MANLSERFTDNAPGRFYVDASCIDCDQCRETAPAFFTRNADAGHSYLQRQPSTTDENELVEGVKNNCPVQAIGDDGS